VNRREFLQTVTGAAIANLAASPSEGSGIAPDKEKAMAPKWQIGCFNRPWSNWSYDEALDGMKAAGFHLTGFLGDHKGESFIYPEATPESLDSLHGRCEAHELDRIAQPLLGAQQDRTAIQRRTVPARLADDGPRSHGHFLDHRA